MYSFINMQLTQYTAQHVAPVFTLESFACEPALVHQYHFLIPWIFRKGKKSYIGNVTHLNYFKRILIKKEVENCNVMLLFWAWLHKITYLDEFNFIWFFQAGRLYMLNLLKLLNLNLSLLPDTKICKFVKHSNLSNSIEANQKVVHFLDVTLDLKSGEYKPFMKPNNTIQYWEALADSGYAAKLKFEPEANQSNIKQSRGRKIIWSTIFLIFNRKTVKLSYITINYAQHKTSGFNAKL